MYYGIGGVMNCFLNTMKLNDADISSYILSNLVHFLYDLKPNPKPHSHNNFFNQKKMVKKGIMGMGFTGTSRNRNKPNPHSHNMFF